MKSDDLVHGNDAAVEALLRFLGMPRRTRSFELRGKVGEYVVADVEYFPTDGSSETETRRFYLAGDGTGPFRLVSDDDLET